MKKIFRKLFRNDKWVLIPRDMKYIRKKFFGLVGKEEFIPCKMYKKENSITGQLEFKYIKIK
jgi:hypothetical protein